jgi:hypothetical protein
VLKSVRKTEHLFRVGRETGLGQLKGRLDCVDRPRGRSSGAPVRTARGAVHEGTSHLARRRSQGPCLRMASRLANGKVVAGRE